MTSLPLFKGATLVVETEVAARKPPLDRTAERGVSAPAIGVAGALAAAGVVDPLEEGPRDPPTLALLAVFEREAYSEPTTTSPLIRSSVRLTRGRTRTFRPRATAVA